MLNLNRKVLLHLVLVATAMVLYCCDSGSGGDAPAHCEDSMADWELPYVADETFFMGPYLMSATQSSMVVMWHTILEEDGKVLYGTGDVPDQELSQEGLSLIHEIHLDGLEPDTRY